MGQLELKLRSGILFDTFDEPTFVIDRANEIFLAIGEFRKITNDFGALKSSYESVPGNNPEDIIMLKIDNQYVLDNSFSDVNYAITFYDNLQEASKVKNISIDYKKDKLSDRQFEINPVVLNTAKYLKLQSEIENLKKAVKILTFMR